MGYFLVVCQPGGLSQSHKMTKGISTAVVSKRKLDVTILLRVMQLWLQGVKK